jgi:transposase InsO family protein
MVGSVVGLVASLLSLVLSLLISTSHGIFTTQQSQFAARCTVTRLMRDMGLQGAIRGKPLRTTISDKAAPCPLDHVNRQFHASAPDRLWLADFTYVATWAGFDYVGARRLCPGRSRTGVP